MKKQKRQRLIIDINEDLHAEIKARAAFRHMSMTSYVLQTLIARMRQEQLYETPEK